MMHCDCETHDHEVWSDRDHRRIRCKVCGQERDWGSEQYGPYLDGWQAGSLGSLGHREEDKMPNERAKALWRAGQRDGSESLREFRKQLLGES